MSERYDENILRSLRRITRAIDLHSRRLASSYDLTAPQLVCLRQLARDGNTTPGKLAEAVALSQATVTGILDRLEKRDLIRRERDREDRRKVNLSLTASGSGLVDRAPTPLQHTFAARLESLPEAEQQSIARILSLVVHMMEADDIDAEPVLAAGPVTADPGDVTKFLDSTADDRPARRKPRTD